MPNWKSVMRSVRMEGKKEREKEENCEDHRSVEKL